jgi:hypothetical protein
MRILVLLACCCYWLALTALLLSPDPADLAGLDEVPMFPWGGVGIHLVALAGLGFLANATRWPKRPSWSLTAILVTYGIAMELLQWFVPNRTVELLDAIENTLGIAAGSGVYWLLVRLVRLCQDHKVAAGWPRCAGKETIPTK